MAANTEVRKTGIGVVGDVPWGTHCFLFYETEEDLFDVLVPYFKAGLEGGEFCMWVISEPLTERAAQNILGKEIPDFDMHLEKNSIEILQGREWYMSSEDPTFARLTYRWERKIEAALSRGYAGLRVSADTAWLERKDWKEFCEYEKEVNDFIVRRPMIAVCNYPLARSAATEILDVARVHHCAIARRKGRWEVLETSELKQAKTESKRISEEIEQRVIERTGDLTAAKQELGRAENELLHSFEQLRVLTARLQSVREEERARFAREIHDELGQSLTAIKIELSSFFRDSSPDQQQAKKRESILKLIDEANQSVRRIASELRPQVLDDLGLVAAVEWAGEEFEARTGIKCHLDLPAEDIVVEQERATALFRILQEALTNIARHANATEADVRLARENNNFILEVHDNGKGMPVDRLSTERSLGILGMRERAALLGGDVVITGIPGAGTRVKAYMPEGRHRETGA